MQKKSMIFYKGLSGKANQIDSSSSITFALTFCYFREFQFVFNKGMSLNVSLTEAIGQLYLANIISGKLAVLFAKGLSSKFNCFVKSPVSCVIGGLEHVIMCLYRSTNIGVSTQLEADQGLRLLSQLAKSMTALNSLSL